MERLLQEQILPRGCALYPDEDDNSLDVVEFLIK